MPTETYTDVDMAVDAKGTWDGMAFSEIAGVFIGIFLVAIIGNSVVIYVLLQKRRSWNVTTTYLFNLSLADAIFVCTLPLWSQTYLNEMEWKFGLFMCKFVGVVTSVNMYASIFFLTAMSVDRWIAVVYATTVSSVRNSVMARMVCAGVWIAALVFSIPRMLYQTTRIYTKGGVKNLSTIPTTVISNVSAVWRLVSESPVIEDPVLPQEVKSFPVCAFYIPKENKNKKILMGLIEFFAAFCGFIIPMIVICVCYIHIVRTVRLKLISRRVRKERVAVLAAMIVTAFFICWLPKQAMTLYSALGGWWGLFHINERDYNAWYPFFVCLAYANSCVNPFVYAFTATNFKNNIKEVCSSHKAQKSNCAYKMTVTRAEIRLPFSPKKKSGKDLSSDKKRERFIEETVKLAEKESKLADAEQQEYSPLDPRNKLVPVQHNNHNGNEQNRLYPYQFDSSSSGLYYEYYTSPPVLETVPHNDKNTMFTTKADIINHNGNERPGITTNPNWRSQNDIEDDSVF